mmetsp:Transcript_14748/g.17700  ORF Transcript_14748/g.17700 Transcript_14748/m.17700 type:complete len:97 (-) Transcript_14748:249-539(-)
MPYAERVYSVSFVCLCMLLAIKYMAKMSSAVIAHYFQSPEVLSYSNVTFAISEITLIEGNPSSIWKFACCRIDGVFTASAAKVSLLWEFAIIFTFS